MVWLPSRVQQRAGMYVWSVWESTCRHVCMCQWMRALRGGAGEWQVMWWNTSRSPVPPRRLHLQKRLNLILCHSLQTEVSGGAEGFTEWGQPTWRSRAPMCVGHRRGLCRGVVCEKKVSAGIKDGDEDGGMKHAITKLRDEVDGWVRDTWQEVKD